MPYTKKDLEKFTKRLRELRKKPGTKRVDFDPYTMSATITKPKAKKAKLKQDRAKKVKLKEEGKRPVTGGLRQAIAKKRPRVSVDIGMAEIEEKRPKEKVILIKRKRKKPASYPIWDPKKGPRPQPKVTEIGPRPKVTKLVKKPTVSIGMAKIERYKKDKKKKKKSSNPKKSGY
jgi:hypothetical protein